MDVESSVSCKLWLTTEDLSPSFEFFSILFVTLLGLREALGALENIFFRCKYTYFNWFQTNEAKKNLPIVSHSRVCHFFLCFGKIFKKKELIYTFNFKFIFGLFICNEDKSILNKRYINIYNIKYILIKN